MLKYVNCDIYMYRVTHKKMAPIKTAKSRNSALTARFFRFLKRSKILNFDRVTLLWSFKWCHFFVSPGMMFFVCKLSSEMMEYIWEKSSICTVSNSGGIWVMVLILPRVFLDTFFDFLRNSFHFKGKYLNSKLHIKVRASVSAFLTMLTSNFTL